MQSLENSKEKGVLDQFDVTLGARVNTATKTDQEIQGEATENQHAITSADRSNISKRPGLNLHHETVGGCGLSSLVSSPTENYSFYARTAVRGSCKQNTRPSNWDA